MGKKIFYGWYIVAACLLIAAAGIGFLNTASIFIIPVTEDLGLSRGEFTFFRTIVVVLSAALLPVYGKLARRISIKKILIIGTTISSLSFMGFAAGSYIWHFYLIAIVSGVFVNASHFMILGILINRWFDDKKGLALGIAFAGSGLGAAIMVPLVSRVIENYGWRSGFIFSGVTALVVLIPTILFLVKERPEDIGLSPYKNDSGNEIDSRQDQKVQTGLTLSEARKEPAFWLLAVALLCVSIGASAPNAHTAPYLEDLGYPVQVVAAMVSLTFIMLTGGKILMGLFFDRFGTLVGGIVLGILCVLSPVFAILAAHPPAPWLHAIFLGLASTGFSIPVNIYALKFFGEKDFPAILSILSMIMAFGAAFSPPLMGFAYDFLDSYLIAWQSLVVLGVIATIGLIGVNLTGKRLLHV
ncbi:MAG: MFS transporter [Oscillospiraceae bacterium]|nr:MFS transporter [Oscillospiraceae bacterium]MCL2277865.1 MFS transporter [Oscillospiraceae bacterium]